MEEVKYLPCEIVSDILSRCRIKCLMQFKSVCKSWFSLIEDPSFIELQFKRSKNKVLLLDRDEGRKDMRKARDIELEYTIKYKKKKNKLVFSIVGSCNGYGRCSMFYGMFICGGCFFNEGQIGFGVDSSDKYKVIQIYRKLATDVHGNYDYEMKGEIITLGESSWTKIEIPYSRHDARGMHRAVEGMVFINGVLSCIPIILVFDLDDEKFHTIEFPPFIESLKDNQLYHCDHIRVAVTWPNIYNYFDLVSMLSNNLLLYRVNDKECSLPEHVDPQLVTERGSHLLVYCLEKKQFILVSPIAIACGMTKKDTRFRFQGLHLEVMGYSSLCELMDSCQFHPTFSIYRGSHLSW
ncbi:hypothetical protein NE237_026147 [Protea cynaroides]|uniref:F-box domain-containing protein n=1 Tax=Protea cynaroides TaxID=273540 RepID=A0A9Q0H5K8_9MAGN|nr:hypothetical protein NE237_026147 [Protea cynaroides]